MATSNRSTRTARCHFCKERVPAEELVVTGEGKKACEECRSNWMHEADVADYAATLCVNCGEVVRAEEYHGAGLRLFCGCNSPEPAGLTPAASPLTDCLLTHAQLIAARKMTAAEKAEAFGALITWIPTEDGAMDCISPISGRRYSLKDGTCSCLSSRGCWHLTAYRKAWPQQAARTVRGFESRDAYRAALKADFGD